MDAASIIIGLATSAFGGVAGEFAKWLLARVRK